MKDITVLIPLHDINVQYTEMLLNAINNVESMTYDGNVIINVILPEEYDYPVIESKKPIKFLSNPGATDYCSQINFGVSQVETEYFSIMEVDDTYNTKWFNMFNNYLNTHEDVSIFLPINVVHNVKSNSREFVNHIAWSTGFTAHSENADVADMSNVGFITFNALQDTASFNLTGAIFKTSDWLGYKPSIQVAFNYEYLLRATNPKSETHTKQLVYVVPKEGYYHTIYRKGSLVEKYLNEISDEDTVKWFELAKREYSFDEDRNNGIIDEKREVLK